MVTTRTKHTPGTPGTRKFGLNLYDTEREDINLFDSIDAEQMKLTGSDVYYFKFHFDPDYDDVYEENRKKTLEVEPILVTAHFNPRAIEEVMGDFGMEETNDQIFIFNKREIENELGRRPIPGDQILTDFQKIKYEIYEVQEDSFRIYGVYHYNCYARVLRDNQDTLSESIDIREEDDELTN